MRALALLLIAMSSSAQTVTIRDAAHQMEAQIAPAQGMNGFDLKVKGLPVVWSPNMRQGGNPLLWPWANRLDAETYWVNGKEYRLNPALKNYGMDGHKQPIHGLLNYKSEWKVIQTNQNEVTAKLEFWRHPAMMAQFPFAHNITITYRLQDGALEVDTLIENLGTEPLPVSLGYHPYFQLHDAPRDEWTVHLPAKEQVILGPTLVPTGERKPNPYPDPVTLKGVALDDVFTSLVRDPDGRARFWVQGKQQRVTVEYGAKYPVAVVYAPPGRGFICFEPMTAPTNAFNLAQRGLYADLQSVAPGATWREQYVIRPSGF